MQKRLLRSLIVPVLAVGFLVGCASTDAKKDDNTEYEYIKVTGSNMRIKVKKGEKYDGGTTGVSTGSSLETHEVPNQAEAPAGAAGG